MVIYRVFTQHPPFLPPAERHHIQSRPLFPSPSITLNDKDGKNGRLIPSFSITPFHSSPTLFTLRRITSSFCFSCKNTRGEGPLPPQYLKLCSNCYQVSPPPAHPQRAHRTEFTPLDKSFNSHSFSSLHTLSRHGILLSPFVSRASTLFPSTRGGRGPIPVFPLFPAPTSSMHIRRSLLSAPPPE